MENLVSFIIYNCFLERLFKFKNIYYKFYFSFLLFVGQAKQLSIQCKLLLHIDISVLLHFDLHIPSKKTSALAESIHIDNVLSLSSSLTPNIIRANLELCMFLLMLLVVL